MFVRYKPYLLGTAYGLLLGLFATGVLLVVSRRPPGHPVELQPPPTPTLLRVHVTGAVNAPGVYTLSHGSIWNDAIYSAGGPTRLADLSSINLARLVVDGEQIAIPEIPPTPTPAPPTPIPRPTITTGPGTPSPTPPPTATIAPTASSAPASLQGKVNINTAGLAELESLPRIGPALAQRILDYRAANGPFAAIEDIIRVSGIGPATFEQIKDLITVN